MLQSDNYLEKEGETMLRTMSHPASPTATGRREGLRPGVVAGLVAGVVLSFYMAAMSIAKGQDLWVGAKMAGMPFTGERAMNPGFEAGPVAIGLLSHFAVSAVWGALFGLLAIPLNRKGVLAAGVAWGIFVWIMMFYGVLPTLGLQRLVEMTPVGAAIFEHVLFGLAVAVSFLRFRRA